jgi:two-component system nitrate/nitrite response regulator NarL
MITIPMPGSFFWSGRTKSDSICSMRTSSSASSMRCVEKSMGWIVHTARSGILIKSLELIAMGKRIFPEDTLERGAPSGAEVSLKAVGVGSALPNPSTREMEVLRSLAKGSPNKIIARDLSIAEATVKVHVKAILRKTPFQNRTEVAQRAQETGIFHEAS